MELSLQQIAQWTEGTIHGENVTLSDTVVVVWVAKSWI